MSDLTVACVLWVGDFMERHYGPDDVYRLRGMVERHLSAPYTFVCLSNVDVPGVEVIPLRNNWPGWWAKVELFAPWFQPTRCLYIDLDVLITGSLDEIARYRAPFVMAPSYYEIMPPVKKKHKIGVVRRYQSSCMAWTAPQGARIYKRFGPSEMLKYRSDQDYIGDILPRLPTFNADWIRKVRQCPDGPPPDCKIVLLHREALPAWAVSTGV